MLYSNISHSLRSSHHLGIHAGPDQGDVPAQLEDQFGVEPHVRHVGRKVIRIEGEVCGRIVYILRKDQQREI